MDDLCAIGTRSLGSSLSLACTQLVDFRGACNWEFIFLRTKGNGARHYRFELLALFRFSMCAYKHDISDEIYIGFF